MSLVHTRAEASEQAAQIGPASMCVVLTALCPPRCAFNYAPPCGERGSYAHNAGFSWTEHCCTSSMFSSTVWTRELVTTSASTLRSSFWIFGAPSIMRVRRTVRIKIPPSQPCNVYQFDVYLYVSYCNKISSNCIKLIIVHQDMQSYVNKGVFCLCCDVTRSMILDLYLWYSW